jgi:hypothetical protein
MDRRSFLIQASAAATACTCFPFSKAQGKPGVTAELTLSERPQAQVMPLDYMGLSYELAQLTDPHFFSASNRDLVAHFRLLSPNGVLRIGGNTSEFCWFRANAATQPPTLRVPTGSLEANWMPHRLFEIKPDAIDALAGFLAATGWRLIYGLNFGNSTPERAAEEAAYVAARVGDRLAFFQIGNEPDFYHDANNGTRPPNWSFDDYLQEWSGFAHAIASRVPTARFGGPDVGASSDWVTRFGEQVPASVSDRLVALTGHYYAEGPPNDPRVTTERLLAGNPRIAAEMARIETVARAHGRIYRMTEGNSCYRGGKPGMSDAFAAALWAGDYLLQLASLGCAGVNLHGGGSAYLTAGLGDHTPGLDVAKKPQRLKSGYYTPISAEPGSGVRAMPVFYGMLLANQLAGDTLLDASLHLTGVNATAYAARGKEVFKVAVFNKDGENPLDLDVRLPRKTHKATAWRLQAPALDATQGVTLAGAEVTSSGDWSPRNSEQVPVRGGVARLRIPAASAALIFLR